MGEVKRSGRHGGGNVQTKTRSSSDGEDVGNRQQEVEGRGETIRRIIRVPVIILMSIVVPVIVLLLVNDRAGCDMRRLHDPGLGRPHTTSQHHQ